MLHNNIVVPRLTLIQADRTYTFETSTPPVSYFLKSAAGIEKGAQKPGNKTV